MQEKWSETKNLPIREINAPSGGECIDFAGFIPSLGVGASIPVCSHPLVHRFWFPPPPRCIDFCLPCSPGASIFYILHVPVQPAASGAWPQVGTTNEYCTRLNPFFAISVWGLCCCYITAYHPSLASPQLPKETGSGP